MQGRERGPRQKAHRVYPASSVLAYETVTVAHYLLGSVGILIGFGAFDWAPWAALAYALFAFGQMYVAMPLMVCRNCVYHRMEGARCVSGLNRVARRIAREGRLEDFEKRAGGLSHNKLYMASFIIPIVAIAVALVMEHSVVALLLLVAVVALFAVRFFVLFKRVACPHCMAKHRCPNARSMGIE